MDVTQNSVAVNEIWIGQRIIDELKYIPVNEMTNFC